MKILVINAGSSSIKYQLIDMDDESVIAKGQAERIGIEGSIQLNVASTLSQQCTFLQEEVDCLSERRVAPFFVSHV